ncbi:MAG: hypothetical protein WC955_09840, partial [Elusimicrobiota bacterium]
MPKLLNIFFSVLYGITLLTVLPADIFSAEHVVFNQQAGFYKDGNRFGYIKVKIIDSTTVIAGEEVYACT